MIAKFNQNIVASKETKKLPPGIIGRNVESIKAMDARCI
jgi:hypothetical protein